MGMASPTDGTLAQLFWGRVQNSNALPAQMVKRKGQWHTLTWAQVGEVVHRLALGLSPSSLSPWCRAWPGARVCRS
jgi:long-subunit acyl-CoA synthetase (AMP-forming)